MSKFSSAKIIVLEAKKNAHISHGCVVVMKAAIRTTYRPIMEALLLQLPEASGAGLELQGVGLVLLEANLGLRQV